MIPKYVLGVCNKDNDTLEVFCVGNLQRSNWNIPDLVFCNSA